MGSNWEDPDAGGHLVWRRVIRLRLGNQEAWKGRSRCNYKAKVKGNPTSTPEVEVGWAQGGMALGSFFRQDWVGMWLVILHVNSDMLMRFPGVLVQLWSRASWDKPKGNSW